MIMITLKNMKSTFLILALFKIMFCYDRVRPDFCGSFCVLGITELVYALTHNMPLVPVSRVSQLALMAYLKVGRGCS